MMGAKLPLGLLSLAALLSCGHGELLATLFNHDLLDLRIPELVPNPAVVSAVWRESRRQFAKPLPVVAGCSGGVVHIKDPYYKRGGGKITHSICGANTKSTTYTSFGPKVKLIINTTHNGQVSSEGFKIKIKLNKNCSCGGVIKLRSDTRNDHCERKNVLSFNNSNTQKSSGPSTCTYHVKTTKKIFAGVSFDKFNFAANSNCSVGSNFAWSNKGDKANLQHYCGNKPPNVKPARFSIFQVINNGDNPDVGLHLSALGKRGVQAADQLGAPKCACGVVASSKGQKLGLRKTTTKSENRETTRKHHSTVGQKKTTNFRKIYNDKEEKTTHKKRKTTKRKHHGKGSQKKTSTRRGEHKKRTKRTTRKGTKRDQTNAKKTTERIHRGKGSQKKTSTRRGNRNRRTKRTTRKGTKPAQTNAKKTTQRTHHRGSQTRPRTTTDDRKGGKPGRIKRSVKETNPSKSSGKTTAKKTPRRLNKRPNNGNKKRSTKKRSTKKRKPHKGSIKKTTKKRKPHKGSIKKTTRKRKPNKGSIKKTTRKRKPHKGSIKKTTRKRQPGSNNQKTSRRPKKSTTRTIQRDKVVVRPRKGGKIRAWPWIASIKDGSAGKLCQGILVQDNLVVTSETCVPITTKASSLEVLINDQLYGTTESLEKTVTVKSITQDSSCQTSPSKCMTLLKISAARESGSTTIVPVCLGCQNIDDPAVKSKGFISGYSINATATNKDDIAAKRNLLTAKAEVVATSECPHAKGKMYCIAIRGPETFSCGKVSDVGMAFFMQDRVKGYKPHYTLKGIIDSVDCTTRKAAVLPLSQNQPNILASIDSICALPARSGIKKPSGR